LTVGEDDGEDVVGDADGEDVVGDADGEDVGDADGEEVVGDADGEDVVGDADGEDVGDADGELVGDADGELVGAFSPWSRSLPQWLPEGIVEESGYLFSMMHTELSFGSNLLVKHSPSSASLRESRLS